MGEDAKKKDNPFYCNPIFNQGYIGLYRPFSKWHWLWIWLWPTYVQCADGYAFFYKNINGRIWIIKDEPLPSRRDNAVKLAHDEMSAEKNYKWKPGDPVWPPDKQPKRGE